LPHKIHPAFLKEILVNRFWPLSLVLTFVFLVTTAAVGHRVSAVPAQSDTWLGNCGTYVFDDSLSTDLSHPPASSVPQPSPNLKSICLAEFSTPDGTDVNSSGWIYYNLDAVTKKLLENGTLTIYQYVNGAWQACLDPLYNASFGEHGRIGCYSSDISYLGIGTRLARRVECTNRTLSTVFTSTIFSPTISYSYLTYPYISFCPGSFTTL
jgi:hypothetical protein